MPGRRNFREDWAMLRKADNRGDTKPPFYKAFDDSLGFLDNKSKQALLLYVNQNLKPKNLEDVNEEDLRQVLSGLFDSNITSLILSEARKRLS